MCLSEYLASIDCEGLACNKLVFVGRLAEVVKNGRIRGISDHIVFDESVLLDIKRLLAANGTEVVLAEPFFL